jgi:penicillin-binding protein 1C
MIKTWLFWLTRSTLLMVIAFIAFVFADRQFPLPADLLNQDNYARLIVARDGTPLRAFADKNGVWRYPVKKKDVSPVYLKTLLAYEDRWFYYHPGVNPFAILRAGVQNFYHGKVISGGSTLTMQVARILDPHSRTMAGKLKQIFRALQLERRYSKDEILTLYLNLAPFGGPIEGVQAASYAYLSKPAKELSLAEAALLSVLPQSPSRFRPDRHPQRATKARDKVLKRLKAFGYISQQEVEDAQLEIVVPQMEAMPMMAPILARRLKNQMSSGAVLTTTIDSQLQGSLESLLKGFTERLPEKSSAAILVVNHHTMKVSAYVASADFFDVKRFGQVDMIQAIRSPGSTLKPFLYAMALDQGLISSHSMLSDQKLDIDGYTPENFSRNYSGFVSMNEALQRSLNIPAIQVLQYLGPGYFYNKLENSGLQLYLPAHSQPNLSIALGGAGTRLEHLVSAYTAFSRAGKAGELRFIEKAKPVKEHYLMSEGAAWIIRKILSGIQYRESYSQLVNHHYSLAWKTGTSYGFRDAWAIGMTNDYTIGIWTGRPDGTPVPGQYGAQTAVPLLKMVAMNLSNYSKDNSYPIKHISQPESVSQAIICWPQGKLKSDTLPENCHQTYLSWILDDTIPPVLYRQPDLDVVLNELKIISIKNGDIVRKPEGSQKPVSINLVTKGGNGGVIWFVNGMPINKTASRSKLTYQFSKKGIYQISAIDETGYSDEVSIRVN